MTEATEEERRRAEAERMEKDNLVKNIAVKSAVVVYMSLLTVFVSYYISKIFAEILWDNERTAITAFISFSFFVSLIYFVITEKKILRLMFIYHFVLLGTAICGLIPLEFRPYMLIPMVITALCGVKAGLVVNGTVCGVLFMGMGEYPLYVFGVSLIAVGALACLAVNSYNRLYKNILVIISYFACELMFLLFFRYYCKESGSEYESSSFVIKIMITCILSLIMANVIKIVIDMFIHKKTPDFLLRKITSDKFEAVMLMREKSASLYYHSTEVAEMSRLAAKRIGANYNLAYAGGLYHDIGKLAGNEYIKEGLKLADRYGIPIEVKAIIVEHNVKSRLPKTKEAAIVMLSDTAVSAIEYVKGTMDKKDISERAIMENALNKRLVTGALRKSGLSIEEFDEIKATLIGIKEQQ